jgi:hypothetical protein
MTINITTTDKIMSKMKADSFGEGVRYALDYLHEVYGEGIEETDIWANYMNEDRN